jgi:hypothetical protein
MYALAALTLLSYTPLAASRSPNTPNENLVLADCGIGLGVNGGSTSREAIYYSGDVWTGNGDQTNNPTMMVNVPWTGQYPWTQGGGLGFTTPNNDFWAVYINGEVRDPNEAGLAAHSYDPYVNLLCYSYHRDRVFQLADGKWCSSAYVCNHRGRAYDRPGPPPPPPAPEPQQTEIHGSTNSEWVEFRNTPASHVMSTARQAFISDGYMCDTTPRPINSKCSIRWKCSGDPATDALNRMASVFDALAKSDKFTSMREVSTEVCRHWDSRPGKEGQCRQWETKVDQYFRMPKTLDLVMRNLPRPGSGDNSNEHGRLEYAVECSESVWECTLCQAIGTALSISVPSAGAAVSIGCSLSGC